MGSGEHKNLWRGGGAIEPSTSAFFTYTHTHTHAWTEYVIHSTLPASLSDKIQALRKISTSPGMCGAQGVLVQSQEREAS